MNNYKKITIIIAIIYMNGKENKRIQVRNFFCKVAYRYNQKKKGGKIVINKTMFTQNA